MASPARPRLERRGGRRHRLAEAAAPLQEHAVQRHLRHPRHPALPAHRRGGDTWTGRRAPSTGWTRTLRRPDGFIDDGINRKDDGRIDDWQFSYNQGLYIGACAELAAIGRTELTARAFATEQAAFAELAVDGVPDDRGDGGDVPLFKGVWYRYAAQLALSPGAGTDDSERVRAHLITGCDTLWARALHGDDLLAGPDWRRQATGRVPLSAQLAAVIATEACARLASVAPGQPAPNPQPRVSLR